MLAVVTCILGSAGLLAPEPADAESALFRVQRYFAGAPFPPVGAFGTPSSLAAGPVFTYAGRYISPLNPDQGWTRTWYDYDGITMDDKAGTMNVTMSPTRRTQASFLKPGARADVEPGNPVGSKFTLPTGWLETQFTATAFPSTAWTGYLTQTFADYQNLQARFGPDNPYGVTGSAKQTITFMGDGAYLGNYPLISTTTANDPGKKVYTTSHGGNLGFSRNGKIKITPGENNFGGTMRFLLDPVGQHWYQYKSVGAPLFFKGYFTSQCTRMGNVCSTKSYETDVGEVHKYGQGILKLLEEDQITGGPTPRFDKTMYRPLRSPAVTSDVYYFNTLAPWTTGIATVTNMTGKTSLYGGQARGEGGDWVPTPGSVDTTLTRTATDVRYKGEGYGVYYPTKKYYSTLMGITRIVSLVRPRIVHAYIIPRIATDPIYTNWQANRVWFMDVYFLPEPSAVLMLGSGILGLAGLAFVRRR